MRLPGFPLRLAAALLAVTLSGSAGPALAISDATAAQHNDLTEALVGAGIKLYLDADICRANSRLGGFYHSPSLSLILCNKGSKKMTEENLDTLRHEAIHVIQDCKNNIQGDKILGRVLKPGTIESLAEKHGISLEQIARVYKSQGADPSVIQLEYEAFTAAAGMSASTIASAVRIMCPVR